MNGLVRFALCAFYPRVDDVPGLAELGVDEAVERLRHDATTLFWIGLVGAAFFFQVTPVVTVKKPVLAAMLSPEDLDRHAYRIATHPAYLVRQIIVLLKLVAGMIWGQSAAIRARMALPPYPPDPGTRRTERLVARPVPPPREPVEALVTLGRSELARGRGAGGRHA
jgi:hypothetical protein